MDNFYSNPTKTKKKRETQQNLKNSRNMPNFTCLACSVRFTDGERQREHFGTDWHRFVEGFLPKNQVSDNFTIFVHKQIQPEEKNLRTATNHFRRVSVARFTSSPRRYRGTAGSVAVL